MNKQVILHVVISLATGGLERFVLDLVEANKHEYDQHIICLEKAGNLAECSHVEVVELDLPAGLHLAAAWNIAKVVRSKKVNLIHTHNEKAQFYGGLAGLLTTTPVVHTKHGKNSSELSSVVRNYLLAKTCRKIVAVSNDAALECIHLEKIPPKKVLTIINGVNTDRFIPTSNRVPIKKCLSIDEDVPIIGVVARLAAIKDHKTLLMACSLLQIRKLPFILLVVGDGPLRTELSDLVDVLKLNNHVKFLGNRTDVSDLMQILDVFVLSSLSEGISLTIVEAMACAIPVVATAVGGTPEVIIEGQNGYLVPPQDPELLSNRLALLIENPALRKQFGTFGRIRAEDYFSLNRASKEYRNLYNMLLGYT